MKKPIYISLFDIEGSGPLAIDWSNGPFGDAVEALNVDGVGFFSRRGELLAVEFDDVNVKKDHQFLDFPNYRVEATVKNGKVTVKVEEKKHPRAQRKAA